MSRTTYHRFRGSRPERSGWGVIAECQRRFRASHQISPKPSLRKEQLRGMLAIEGVLIAGVGATLGIVLGLIFRWAGAATALSLMGDVRYAVPWTDVGAVVAIALVAGLLASVLPARAAARTSPVAALGVE
ncbi:ABC transporter permease [Micromonospora parva]|uniref:ABC transporter permease n=1 Tax=Micromonospora parva TaxID=1464048 RepID=UPI0033E76659